MFANVILLTAVYFLQQEVGGVINILNNQILIIMVVFVFITGILLSFFSSWLSVVTYLNKDLNDLYQV